MSHPESFSTESFSKPPELHRITVPSLQAFSEIAAVIARHLSPGDVVALIGDLGAGKTTFTQQIAQYWGVSEKVASPTFVLMHEYLTGRIPIVHADLYRLGPEGSQSLAEELLGIIAEMESIVLVEWADYAPYLHPCITLSIHILFNPADGGELENMRLLEIETAKRPLIHELLQRSGQTIHPENPSEESPGCP